MKIQHSLFTYILCITVIGTLCQITDVGASPYTPADSIEQMQLDLESLFPANEVPAGWKRASAIRTFTEENLFEHIDGAAESFFAYQFQLCGTSTYTPENGGDEFITVDIYDMNTSLNAYGMYNSERYPDAEIIDIGAQGYADTSVVNFWEDKYYVKLLATKESDLFSDASIKLAQAIAKSIFGQSSTPYLAQLLPKESIVKNSERFVLENVLGHGFLRRGMIARYQIGSQSKEIVLFDCQTESDAQNTFISFKSYEEKSGQTVAVKKLELYDEFFSAQDRYYKNIFVTRIGKFVIVAVKVEDEKATYAFLEKFAKRISEVESIHIAHIFVVNIGNTSKHRLDISPPAQMIDGRIWLPVASFAGEMSATVVADEEKIIMLYRGDEIQLNKNSPNVHSQNKIVFVSLEALARPMKLQYDVDVDRREIYILPEILF